METSDDGVGQRLVQGAKAALWYPLALGLVFLSPFLYLPKLIACALLPIITDHDDDYWDHRLGVWWAILWGTIGAAFWVTLGILMALNR
jgi:hypothetical protein